MPALLHRCPCGNQVSEHDDLICRECIELDAPLGLEEGNCDSCGHMTIVYSDGLCSTCRSNDVEAGF